MCVCEGYKYRQIKNCRVGEEAKKNPVEVSGATNRVFERFMEAARVCQPLLPVLLL